MKRLLPVIVVVALFVAAVVTMRLQTNQRATEKSESSNATSAGSSRERIAPGASGSTAVETEQQRRIRMLSNSTNRDDFHLSEVDVYRYVEASRTNALSLVTAFEVSRNKDALRAAATNFPNDPFVQAKVIMHDAFPGERAKWIDAFKKSAPDNSLPNLFAAQDRLKAGDVAGALAEIGAAEGKAFNDYTRESSQGLEEAYLLAGRSITEAKALGMAEITLPHLAPFKATSIELNKLAETYAGSGNIEGQLQLLGASWEFGNQLRGTSSGLITDLVGLAIQNNALKSWPEGQTAPFLTRAASEELAANLEYRKEIQSAAPLFNKWFPEAPDYEIITYMDRVKTFGERDAMAWLRQRHPELATATKAP